MSRLSRSERSKNRRSRNPLATSLTACLLLPAPSAGHAGLRLLPLAHRSPTIAAPSCRHDGNQPTAAASRASAAVAPLSCRRQRHSELMLLLITAICWGTYHRRGHSLAGYQLLGEALP